MGTKRDLTTVRIAAQPVEQSIHLIRGQRVMLDYELAELYGVPTHRLNEQVRRNIQRFPNDFMFQLTDNEFRGLRSQFAITKLSRRRTAPYAFTEHGALMAANVLNTSIAIEMSVHVIRAFVRLREMIASNHELARRLQQLERKIGLHDEEIKQLFNAIKMLMLPPNPKKKRRIGF